MMERIERLREMLKESPKDSFLMHALALENIKIGKDEDAKALFIEILDNNPEYVGSYYHLAKLLERSKDDVAALEIYEKGMLQAKAVNDKHAYNELMMARDENDAYDF